MADTTIIGGMQATSPTSNFSIGVCGIISITSSSGSETIYDGVCSCGHGKTLSETVKVGGNTFGKVNVLRYQNNSNGDFSCIRMTSEKDTLTNKVYGTSLNNTRSITSTTDNAAKNAVVMKFGAKKGYGTGTVSDNNITITTSFNNVKVSLNGMCKCSIDSGSFEEGDSGGPCYISGYSFVGVYHGHTTSNFYFTPYVRFKTYFYPKTSG